MTTTRCLLWLALLLALEAPAAAQTVRADRVTLNAGPCVITSGPTAPNGNRIGNPCDTFIVSPPGTGAGAIWTKTSGVGTSSGWIATLAGTGTPGTLPVWTSASAIGDSIIAQAGGVATITGAEHVTGNSTIGGSVDVTGAATLRSNLDVTGAATLRADTSISGNTVLGGWIGSVSYASQVSGWRITNTGAADVRYLFTDELRAKLFAADAESVLAGSMRVTKSYSTVAQPFTCPVLFGGGPLWVYDASTYGDAPVFQSGDIVLIHLLTRAAFGPFTIADCVGTVSTYADGSGTAAGQQSWNFQRLGGANGGSMTSGTVVPVNQLVQDMGVSGNGYVEMSAVDGANGVNAPYIQTNTWTTSPIAANTTTNCRLGNLAGIMGSGPEYGLTCVGAVGSNTFLRASNVAFELRNLPFTMYDASTAVFYINPAGPYLGLGSPLPTAFAGGNAGLWAGKDTDGTYKLRIGNPTGNRLTWNGSQLSIVGEGSGITNINGGNIQAGTISATAINVRPIGAALNSDPNVVSQSAWGESNNPNYSAAVTAITDGAVGTHSLRSPSGHSVVPIDVYSIPLDSHKQYRLHAWVRAAAGATGLFQLSILCTNGTGAQLGVVTALSTTGVPTTWTEYSGTLAPLSGGTVAGNLLVYLNYNGANIQNAPGYMEVQDVRLEEAAPSTLIKDGAITTAKIQAGAITADQIASNTITVGNLNATGFGDNLIKNSTFEGTAAHALDGWSVDPASVGSMSQNCCGTRGPGDLFLQTTAGNYVLVAYYAVPVQVGLAYRVALDIYAGTASASGVYIRMAESNSSGTPRFIGTYLRTAPDVTQDSQTDLYANGALAVGWNHLEFTYVPPSPVRWVSFSMYNYTCVSGACQALHVDAVEMQPQLGSGHIRAASITADRLVANTITAAQIAAGTITSAQIAASTITGGNIAGGTITGGNIAGRTITAGALVANTITSNEIGVRAIVAGNLAANTITAAEIAAGTITADRMNVSTLSAITANLGAVNAGSLNAVTITGSTITGTNVTAGCATMNSNGITLTAGGGACNWYKFSNGTIGMSSDGGAWMYVQGPNVQIYGTGSGGYLNLQADSILHAGGQVVLDTNGQQLRVTPAGYLQLSLASLPGGSATHLCLTSDGYLQRCA
jgi:hypothetical protein